MPEYDQMLGIVLMLADRLEELEAEIEEMQSGPIEERPEEGGESAGYPTLFDLYDVTAPAGDTNTVKVRGHAKFFAIATQWIAETAGNDEFDAAIEITEESYIYLEFVRNEYGNTVALKHAAALPAMNDSTQVYPLWYLPWDDTEDAERIDTANILDLRHAIHITTFA